MAPERKAEIEAMLAALTNGGRWKWQGLGEVVITPPYDEANRVVLITTDAEDCDGPFIAAAPQIVRELLDAIDAT